MINFLYKFYYCVIAFKSNKYMNNIVENLKYISNLSNA